MDYKFYGNETRDVKPLQNGSVFAKIKNQREMYDLLSECWSDKTCAPRSAPNWSKENMTLGQCSITSFLVQDIFGGKVYGIELPLGGGYHCYNEVDGVTFDLTSEQFGGAKLCYENNPEQFREVHFADKDKENRYKLLKANLEKILG